MGTPPLVTVVIPTWNRRALVREAVASVLSQTHRNFELIVVDDGSTDGTAEELRALGDSRLHVLAVPHNGNSGQVRNLGVARARSRWIAFLDSDDLWLPRKLELQLAALGRRGARWCYGDYCHVDEAGRETGRRPDFRGDEGRILKSLVEGRNAAFISTLLVERSLFDEAGGFAEALRAREDLDLMLRIAALADAASVREPTALARVHPGRKTAGLIRPHEASALVFERLVARTADPELRRLARSRLADLLADGAGHRLRGGDVGGCLALARRALGAGVSPVFLARRIAGGGWARLRERLRPGRSNAGSGASR